MRLTTDEKNFIVKKYAILGSPVLVQRAWRTKYVCKYVPNGSTITALVKKFDETGAVHNFIRKNKEPSQKRKNAKTKLKMVISEVVRKVYNNYCFKQDGASPHVSKLSQIQRPI